MKARPSTNQYLVLVDGLSIKPVDPGTRFAAEAESVDRLEADAELVQRLMWSEYQGEDWEAFRDALARYGIAVLCKWILSGQIYKECSQKGFGRIRKRRRVDHDEALGIAGETVARALNFFRDKVLIPGIWDPGKGASVRTYFIGSCILLFSNVYELAQGDERLEPCLARTAEGQLLAVQVADARAHSRPDELAELASSFDALPDEETRVMVVHRAQGYSDAEIASVLTTSRKAVEARFYRLHRRNR